MTLLTRTSAIFMMTATISATGRRAEAVAAEQRTADKYPDEIEIPTETVSLRDCPPHY